jgi:hypothetical protein
MSLRPRFAGDGLLQLPSDVHVVRAAGRDTQPGDVICALRGQPIDPFERDAAGILLAEAFARVDLTRPRYVGLNLTSQDTEAEVLAQQRLVRWHLTSLARLTAHRTGAGQGWDPDWSSAFLEGPDDQTAWVGAPSDEEAYFSPTIGLEPPALPAGLPRLPVPQEPWTRYWGGYDLPIPDPGERERRLPTDRGGLLELQRRLIEPYLQSAVASDVRIERQSAAERSDVASADHGAIGQALVIRETRIWGSILAPIYLQLLEGLRRVSEGKPGATWCRECGEVFLTLDARRSTFCTDRERVRYAQRGRPRALAASDAAP